MDDGRFAVECAGLVHRFGDTIAVDHLDLRIPAGDVFGLLGPNGAGKTTLGAGVALMLGSGFFACLSMAIAGLAQARDRLMGIGQLITMPLFFASNALYPIDIMPTWLQVISLVNPLTYLVNALRGLLVGAPANLWADFGVLAVAAAIGVVGAARLMGKLVR
jgi:ABC-2 type transport system permease protein